MKLEDLAVWALSLFGGLALCGARLGWLLFGVAPDPPVDPSAITMWRRKRKWVVVSELSALPAFATVSVVVGRIQGWTLEGTVLLSMVLGALGFAFFLDALQSIVRSRVGISKGGPQ